MKKHLSIRIDDSTYSKLMDQANQDGLTVSESIRDLLEKQTSNETPSYQPDKSIKEQSSNENHSEENQNKRDALKDWMKKQTSELELKRQLKELLKR
jgi:antitoxin component of RelBE/YafQ-DinJ toxin-antitoxin module